LASSLRIAAFLPLMLRTLRTAALAALCLSASVAAQPSPYVTGLTDPYGLIQLADGRVLVTEYLAGEVSVISDGDGVALDAPELFIDDLVFPAGIVQLADGRVLVAEAGGGVSVISDGEASPLDSPQPFIASLKGALGLLRLEDDRVLVAESFRGRVAIISDGGGVPRVNPRTFVNRLQDPEGIVQLADGRVLTSEYNGGGVTLLSTPEAVPLDDPIPYVGGLDSPSGLIQLADGRVLVADIEAGRVAVLSDTNGDPLEQAEDYATGLAQPAGLLQLADGRVLVAEGDAGQVTVIGGSSGGSEVPVSFASVALSASEDAGTVDLVVDVEGEPDVPATVTVTLTDGDADDLGGFTSASFTVDGAGAYAVTVPITDDALVEENESFLFALSVTNGPAAESPLIVTSPSTTTLTVADDDLVTVAVPTAAGPFLFAAPVGGLVASDVAATVGGPVYTYDASARAFVEADADAVFSRGEALLVLSSGDDLELAGGPGPAVLTFETDASAPGGVLAVVGNPTDHPVALDAFEVSGGALTDVALVAEAGALRPVSLGGLSDDAPLVLRPYEVAVLRIAPAESPDDVAVTLAASVEPAEGTPLANAPFVPIEGETAVILSLSGGPGVADSAALRFGVGDADLDAPDLGSPLGGALSVAPTGTADRFAALSLGSLEGGPVTAPLSVDVPEAGPYQIALAGDPGTVGDLVVVVELIDALAGTTTVIQVGAPYAFTVGPGENSSDRFTARVRLVGVDTEGGVPSPTLAVGPIPSAGVVSVRLRSPGGAPVRLAVYDALGREVAVLHDGPTAGGVQTGLPAGALSPGTYVVRATGDGIALARVLTIAR
jgi:glucose/arabinose dehydrogenase